MKKIKCICGCSRIANTIPIDYTLRCAACGRVVVKNMWVENVVLIRQESDSQ